MSIEATIRLDKRLKMMEDKLEDLENQLIEKKVVEKRGRPAKDKKKD